MRTCISCCYIFLRVPAKEPAGALSVADPTYVLEDYTRMAIRLPGAQRLSFTTLSVLRLGPEADVFQRRPGLGPQRRPAHPRRPADRHLDPYLREQQPLPVDPAHDRQPVIEAPTGITFVGYENPPGVTTDQRVRHFLESDRAAWYNHVNLTAHEAGGHFIPWLVPDQWSMTCAAPSAAAASGVAADGGIYRYLAL
jgi:hypothetical protein